MKRTAIHSLLTACLLLSASWAQADEPSLPKRQLAKAQISKLSPSELMTLAGSGVYFRHDIPNVSLSHPSSHAWWEKPSSLLSTSLHLSSVRGQQRIDISIPDYRGPGSYQRGDFTVTLRENGKTWNSVASKAQTLVVQSERDGWINGFFNAVMRHDDEPDLRRISNGVFRLNSEKSPVVAIFENE